METKTYFASSIQAAMEVARRELGPDAMLVGSQQTPESMRQFGRLEVSFAWEPPNAAPAQPAPRPAAPRTNAPVLDDILQEISALRRSMTNAAPDHSPVLRDIDPEAVQALCATGMEEETARTIVAAAATLPGSIRKCVAEELTRRLPVALFAALQPEETRTLAFIGPPGRGKTSSLIKIAVKYGLANRIPTRIFTAGSHPVGAWEQMARYAAILGIPFQVAETFENLNLALQGDRWKGLVLIDTPGQVLGDHREMEAMKFFFSRRQDIERHLVLRADARSADMKYMLNRFAAIQPSRLLFTGIDEAQGLGAVVETMILNTIPASFFGTGPGMPEDMEEVNIGKLVRSIWTAGGLAAAA